MRSTFLRIFLISFGFMAFLSAKGQTAAANSSGNTEFLTTMTLIVMALTLIAFIFVSITKSNEKKAENKMKAVVQNVGNEQIAKTDEAEIAAISAALHLYFDDQHEVEQTGFWLNRELNQCPAWAAKNILFKKLPIRRK